MIGMTAVTWLGENQSTVTHRCGVGAVELPEPDRVRIPGIAQPFVKGSSTLCRLTWYLGHINMVRGARYPSKDMLQCLPIWDFSLRLLVSALGEVDDVMIETSTGFLICT